MLRKEKKKYRFSEEVENELSKLGVYITESKGNGGCQYCKWANQVYVYSDKEHPSIQIVYSLHQYSPDLDNFIKKIDEAKELIIKIYEIVMKDY